MDCHRIFRSQSCFNNHKFIKSYQKKSFCQLLYSCEKRSGRVIGNKKNRVCAGERKCKFCKEIVGPNHQCYIQKYEKNKKCSESEDEQSKEEEESEHQHRNSSSTISSQLKKRENMSTFVWHRELVITA